MKFSPNQLQIQSGQFRGRKISFPNNSMIRPTPNRVRETLFNWLRPRITQARCLDLFSGSGILGFEALSQQAGFVQFIDSDRTACQQINQQLAKLDLTKKAAVENTNALHWLAAQQNSQLTPFDIIFLDPPFDKNLSLECVELLIQANVLSKEAFLYVESNRELSLNLPWENYRKARAGQVNFGLWQYVY